MSQQTTIRKLAELVNTPVEKLLEQLAEAGMSFSGPDQVVTSMEKVKLLGFLKRAHGKAEKPVESAAAPNKITLNRRKVQEITVAAGRTKTTVNVEVRQKRTYVKAGEVEVPQSDERDEVLRKLEESRRRNLSEQQKLAEDDKRRADEIAAKRAQEEEVAKQAAAEAEAAAVVAAAAAEGATEEEVGRAAKPSSHHGKSASRNDVAPRNDDRNAHKHKTRGSHVMVAGVEDDDNAARFAGQLHLSASERARRTGARGKPKARRQVEQSRSGAGGAHGFSRPTAPIVRDVAIGDAITVADLAQKLGVPRP